MRPRTSSAAPTSSAALRRNFAIYSGDDATALALMLLGGDGVISVTANVAPAAHARDVRRRAAGDVKQARELNNHLLGLHRHLFVEANPIPVKWAVAEMGLIAGGIRLPLTPLAEKFHDPVREALREAGRDPRSSACGRTGSIRKILLTAAAAVMRRSRLRVGFRAVDRQSKAGTLPPLEVPPDLTAPTRDDRYAVPEAGGRSSATPSGDVGRAARPPRRARSAGARAARRTSGARRARRHAALARGAGDARRQLWPLVKDFWQEIGFIVNVEMPEPA